MSNKENPPEVEYAQLVYARILSVLSIAGFVLLILSFLAYVTGVIGSSIPLSRLSEFWSLDLRSYLEQTGRGNGWDWIKRLNHADYLNMVPIAFLSVVTILCYGVVLPIFIRRKSWIYVLIVLVEVIILVFAASGLLRIH